MNALRTFRSVFVVALMGSVFSAGTALAEKWDCSGSTARSKQLVSREAINPGDRPDHALVQFVEIQAVSSSNAEWDGTERKVYGHIDGLAAYGGHSGYTAQTSKSGETLWTHYEGVGYTIGTLGVGDWEIRYQGLFQFVAGTGKYRGIRGGGYYNGILKPGVGVVEETFRCEAEY